MLGNRHPSPPARGSCLDGSDSVLASRIRAVHGSVRLVEGAEGRVPPFLLLFMIIPLTARPSVTNQAPVAAALANTYTRGTMHVPAAGPRGSYVLYHARQFQTRYLHRGQRETTAVFRIFRTSCAERYPFTRRQHMRAARAVRSLFVLPLTCVACFIVCFPDFPVPLSNFGGQAGC